MTIQAFFDKWNNKGIDFDGYYGFQCMDLAHRFAVDVNGVDFPGAPAAKDVWNKTIPGYDKIKNTPDGVPQKGDIVIWGVGIGAYGHIAIYDHGNASSFISFDQNWPVNSLCHFQSHNYNGVLGWLRLKTPPTQAPVIEPVITLQTKIPQIYNWEVQKIKSEVDRIPQLEQDLENERNKEVEVVTTTYTKPITSSETPPKTEVTVEIPPVLTNLIEWFKTHWK